MLLDASTPLTYVAEGGAHVVYSIDSSLPPSPTDAPPTDVDFYGPSTPPPTELSPVSTNALHNVTQRMRKVLRLRKAVADDVSHAGVSDHALEATRPRFPSSTVLYEEKAALSSKLLDRLNAGLREMESVGTRPSQRRGVYLQRHQRQVSVLEDMRCRPSLDLLTLEIKPKWMIQSPNAPTGSRRCRTCALRAMRRASGESASNAIGTTSEQGQAQSGDIYGSFCPLDLASGSEPRIKEVVKAVLRADDKLKSLAETDALVRLASFLAHGEALQALQQLQSEYSPNILLPPGDTVNETTMWAMMLRDCTLFVRVSPIDVYPLALRTLWPPLCSWLTGSRCRWTLPRNRKLDSETWAISLSPRRATGRESRNS